MTLIEKVCRAICHEAGAPHGACPHCDMPAGEPVCTLWPTFESEARAAIATIRKSDRGK